MQDSKTTTIKLGLRENISQFSLLVIINAFVGAMIGLERSILPQIAEQEFHLAAKSVILGFIVAFGISKALTNYLAGKYSDLYGRKKILIIGWLFTLPVPLLLMFAQSWNLIILANILLGIGQGLTWSTTVIMKIDLVGAKNRGFAMGINEFAGYLAVAVSALTTGYIAAHFGLRPQPFYLGFFYVLVGLFLSVVFVKETHGHAKSESLKTQTISSKEIFIKTSFKDKNLSSITQAGLVNNLNDGMAWGLFPVLLAQRGFSLSQIGGLVAVYPAVWGICQLFTGHLSDLWGRKKLIVWGMTIQAIAIFCIGFLSTEFSFIFGSILLGVGTALVYPTFLAGIGDVAHPTWRASAVGIYRLWRDLGYAIGAILSGATADIFGLNSAIYLVATLTFLSGIFVKIRMKNDVL